MKNMRLICHIQLENIEKPHMLEVKYPDDKRRHMCINDGTCYDLTTGVVCGFKNQPTNRIQTLENYFYSRWNNESVVFSSWGNGEPAAVSEFYVYELDELPELKIENKCGSRDFGVQYEDPVNVGTSEGTTDYITWTDRLINYLQFTGQNKLIYPINWYHGPIIPVRSQPYGTINTYCAPDRRTYCRTSEQPSDWLDTLLSKFDKSI